jgi:hypothetical protein
MRLRTLRPRILQAPLDRPPLRHEDLELRPSAPGLVAGQRDHPGAAVADSIELGLVMLDAAVPGDDQPPLTGGLWNPDLIRSGRTGDRARRSLSAMHHTAWISGVGHIGSELHHDLGQAEHVRIKVETDRRRPMSWAHAAACSEFS